MAHLRHRHAIQYLKKALQFSPITGLFGHRQIGKTTWLAQNTQPYFTLDDEDTLRKVSDHALNFIKSIKTGPAGIDECQFEPKLFPALKEYVRKYPKPGSFILSGSVRFTARKAIRESLAGRLISIEMLPLTVAEIERLDLGESLSVALKQGPFTTSYSQYIRPMSDKIKLIASVEKYLSHGGLPGICFVREERFRRERMDSLHQLMLDRDLRLITETKLSLQTLVRFLQAIASFGWQPYNGSEVKRRLGLSYATQKNILSAFEAIYLIRRIPSLTSKSEIIVLEDQLEQFLLSSVKMAAEDALIGLVYRNARAQFMYHEDAAASAGYFSLRTGAIIPLVFRQNESAIGIVIVQDDVISPSVRRSIDRFLLDYPSAKMMIMTTQPDIEAVAVSSRIYRAPLWRFM
jgi:predicted AAA+ superfamily ATPase